MEPALNESLKTVYRVKELIKTFLELREMDNEALLYVAIDLLEKSEEALAKTQ